MVHSENNQELYGVNVDFKSFRNKWTIDAILQHMGFHSPTENPSVMVTGNHKTLSSEYIVICQDEIIYCITNTRRNFHMLQDKYKINIYLQGKYRCWLDQR